MEPKKWSISHVYGGMEERRENSRKEREAEEADKVLIVPEVTN